MAARPQRAVHKLPAETEAAFMQAVITLATLHKWLVWHDYDSRRNAAGLPDLVMCKGERLLMIELKTARGRLRPAQRVWLAALANVPGVTACVWRPADWPLIERTLVGDVGR